jgi:microcystin-dependent protein
MNMSHSPNTFQTMKTRNMPSLHTALVGLTLAAALFLSVRNAAAQTTPNPPDLMTYQGFLVDGNGMALGIDAPKNYDVVFRIFAAAAGGNALWTEQQTVVVDKGYFSVLLGEGSSIGEPRPALSTLFANSTASDRWVGITVKGIGPGGANADILPRLRLLTSPYSFLARKAVSASALVNDANVAIVSASGSTLAVNGGLTASSLSGNGANLAELNGSAITTGTVPDSRLSSNVALRAGGNTLDGNQTVTSGAFVGDGTIPVGGIILWSGSIANIPSGWALCDGQTVNGNVTPNLRDRFVVGAGGGYGVGGTGGSDLVTLSGAQLPSHAHSYKDGFHSESSGGSNHFPNGGVDNYGFNVIGSGSTDVDNRYIYWRPMATDPAGGNQPFDNRPPYYALAYIMRVR